MKKCRCILPLTASILLAGADAAAAQATFRVITYMYQYAQPIGILEGSPGVFYSEAGGGPQVALSVTAQGAKTILGTLSNSYNVPSLLVAGDNNLFYSSAQYSLNPVRVFSVGSSPDSLKFYSPQNFDPVMMQNLPGGQLLALALNISSYIWSLATVSLDGVVTPIYQFSTTDLPETALYAGDGNYYGVVQSATASTGYLFRITPSGAFTILYTFPSGTFIGGNPQPLIQAGDGNLYGATATGGTNGTGTIYKLTLGGQYTLLYAFPKNYNSNPVALIEGSDGNLYGATNGNLAFNGGYSELFRITKSGQFTLLYAISNVGADGACQCSLVLGSDGIIYGVASSGGVTGAGAYFALDAGLPKPKPWPQRFNPESGAVGTQVLIWGYNLLSASVQFNGVPATTVSNGGSNYVWATVPAGATTGPITVTTPGGTSTTKGSFIVQ